MRVPALVALPFPRAQNRQAHLALFVQVRTASPATARPRVEVRLRRLERVLCRVEVEVDQVGSVDVGRSGRTDDEHAQKVHPVFVAANEDGVCVQGEREIQL